MFRLLYDCHLARASYAHSREGYFGVSAAVELESLREKQYLKWSSLKRIIL